MFIHIDIDSFFASAERSINPRLNGIPIAVGGRSNLEIFNKDRTNIKLMNDNSGAFVTPVFYSDREKSFESFFVDHINGQRKVRGIITTCSYEARAFGVKTAMPIAQALQLCPHLVVIPSNYRLYHELSKRLNFYMEKKIPKIEQYSIDEFFGNLQGWVSEDECFTFAEALKEDIFKEFGLPVSIGIASSKWIAKVATEKAKPFGVYQVKDIGEFIRDIPIHEFPGVGKAFQERLKSRGITKLGEVEQYQELFYSWGKIGVQLYQRILGIDRESICKRGPRKSIGISRTFDPIRDSGEVRRRVVIMARHIVYMLMGLEVNPTTYFLKVNYEYGAKRKMSRTVDRIFSENLFREQLLEMYDEIVHHALGAVKLTINVSNFTENHHKTLSLLDHEEDMENAKFTREIQSLRDKFGIDIIKSGVEL